MELFILVLYNEQREILSQVNIKSQDVVTAFMLANDILLFGEMLKVNWSYCKLFADEVKGCSIIRLSKDQFERYVKQN